MKKIYIRLLLCLLGVSFGMVSCIHDDTTGFVKEISDISITKVSGEGVNERGDEAFVEFMKPVRFEAEVSQSLEGYELSYEWRVGYITDYRDGEPVIDSMRYISTEPVLEYAFNRVGEFRVRLRVYNEFGSSFYYMTVTVKAGMETGLLVLSADDAGKGRLSFCPVLSDANELLEAKAEDFNVDVWSMINPDYELQDAWDICMMNSGTYRWNVYVVSESQKCIYELEKNTLMVLRKMDLTQLLEWNIQPVALSVYNLDLGVLTQGGQVVGSQLTANGLINDAWWGMNMKAAKLYQADFWNDFNACTISFPMIADNEQEKMFLYQGSSSVYESGNEFSGYRIINYLLTGERAKRLVVVSEPKNSSNKVRVTVFNLVEDHWSLGYLFYKDSENQVRDYDLTAPLTLTSESQILNVWAFGEVFYSNDNKIYRWRYTNALPDATASGRDVLTVPGEVTCMAQSPDGEYLYVGVYGVAGASGLRGSVYVYKTEDFSPVTQFEGIADRPLKLFYKDVK